MPNNNINYITPEEYTTLLKHGLKYKGFVIGVGYAYICTATIPPPTMNIVNPPKFVPHGMDHYRHLKVQCLNTSDEAIELSLKGNTEIDKDNEETELDGDLSLRTYNIALNDATFVVPIIIHNHFKNDSDDIMGNFSTANTIFSTIKPNKFSPYLGWVLTAKSVYCNIKEENYAEAGWDVIGSFGGIYTVSAIGVYQLSQTEYMQTGVGRNAYKQYMYNTKMYKLTGKEKFLDRASKQYKLMRSCHSTIHRKKY